MAAFGAIAGLHSSVLLVLVPDDLLGDFVRTRAICHHDRRIVILLHSLS